MIPPAWTDVWICDHAWRNGRTWVDVRSADINAYIKEVTGGDYTAKDFRTWGATVFAAMALGVSTAVSSPTGRKRAVTRGDQGGGGLFGEHAGGVAVVVHRPSGH